MFVNNRQTVEYQGQLYTRPLDDANMRAMTVCFHENTHAWQDQCVEGMIPCRDAVLLEQYIANNFDITPVLDQDGEFQKGSQYMRGKTSYFYYYLQSTERDAFRFSEAKTLGIMQSLAAKYGTEVSFQAYAQELKTNGYQAMELRAIEMFQNPNIEKEINQVLVNEYYNKSIAVSPEVEKGVREEMVRSYQAIYEGKEMKGEKDMAKEIDNWMNLKVSSQEYSQTLHDTVNAFYQHELDSGLSKEEALANTAPVAENALNAEAEFNASVQENSMETGAEGIGSNEDGGLGATGSEGLGADGGSSSDGLGGDDGSSGLGGDDGDGGLGGDDDGGLGDD